MIRRKSNKLNIIVLSVSLIVVIGLLIFAGTQRADLYEKSVLDAEKKKLSVLARSNALRLQEFIKSKRDQLKILALNPDVQLHLKGDLSVTQGSESAHSTSHKQIDYILKGVKNILFTNADGGYVGADELQCDERLLEVKRPEVKSCLEVKTSHISDFFTTPDGKGAVTICEPVFRGEQFVGVISLLVYMDDINEFLSHVEHKEHGYAYLCDRSGRPISHPRDDIAANNFINKQVEMLNDKKKPFLRLVDSMTSGKTGLIQYYLWDPKFGIVNKMAAFHPVEFDSIGWSLGVSVGYDDIADPIKEFEVYTAITVFCGIIFLVAVFAYYLRSSRQQYQSLLESQKLLQKIIDHIPYRIFWKDTELKLLGGNKLFMETTGYTCTNELEGVDSASLPGTPAQIAFNKECDEQVIRTGHDLRNYEEELLDSHGVVEWFETSRIAIRDSKGEIIGVLGINEPITERKKVHEQLISLTENAERAYKVKSEFLANMSHEIRTPMNAIIGVSEFLLESDLDEKQHNYTDIIKRSSDLLLDILNSVLDYSKIEAGKLKLINKEFDLRVSVEDTVKCFEFNAERKKIKLLCSIDDDVPNVVYGDQGKLRQVLVNLIGNALKFTECGEVEVNIKCYDCERCDPHSSNATVVELVDNSVTLLISIRDTGIGISDDQQHKIFDAFIQADGSASRSHGGTGLGLSISSELVKMMNGDIWLDSVEGEGSTFTFVVQLEAAEQQVEQLEPTQEPSAVDSANATLNILLVDDDPMNQMVVSTMLNKIEGTTELADNGQEAVQLFKENKYDLVLMDIMMPVLDGIAATKEIRAFEQGNGLGHTPIVAFSACVSEEDIEECKAAGCDGYLQKPVRQADLIDKVKEFA